MAPAVKVYGWAMSPFVARALLCLEEAGVEYELVAMSPEAGDHLRPDFLARNPFAQVPVLEDGDLTLFESRAIARHVLRKHRPELLAGDGGDGGRVAGGGGAAAPRPDGRHHDAVHRRPAPRRRARPGRRRRERRQAEEGARGVRGAAVGVEVPRRGVAHPRRPQPLPHDALLHGHRVRGAGGGASACQGVVGGD